MFPVYLNNRGAGLVARNTVLKNEAKTKVDIDPGKFLNNIEMKIKQIGKALTL